MTQSQDDYAAWKGWEQNEGPSDDHITYFTLEMKACGVQQPGKLLEIGFGNGEFLQWAALEGFTPVGVEIRPILVDQGLQKGLNVFEANLCNELPDSLLGQPPFQTVVALDVIEHLGVDDAKSFLRNLIRLTDSEARIVLRFPNGSSPFSTVVQNGDYTHQQAMTESKLKQLSVGTGWKVLQYRNAARSLQVKGRGGLLRRLVYPLRNLVEIGVGNLYYGHRVPLDPVATAVLVRDNPS